jgi:UDP-glucose 4-epimerase
MITNVLLLGGGGFVGQNLALGLLADGFAVTVIDQNAVGVRQNADLAAVACYECAIGDVEQILAVIQERRIDCVINLASSLIPSSNFSMFIKDMEQVVTPSFKLLAELAERGIQYVFFSSGGTIYGHGGPGLIAESSKCEPINFYGHSKKAMEDFITFAGRNCGLKYLIIRPSNPYGRYQNPLRKQGFIAVALHNIMHDLPIEIWGDGSVVRDYIHIDDLTRAVSGLLQSGVSNEIFNIGSGRGHSINEVLSVLSEISGRRVEANYQAGRKVDVQSIVLDVSKLQSFIPYTPLGLMPGTAKYYDYLRGIDAK